MRLISGEEKVGSVELFHRLSQLHAEIKACMVTMIEARDPRFAQGTPVID
jgi:hypothetical protein